ncbi:hypothetical protein ACQY0O_006607 [Thecaphora frezii]
MTMPGLNPAAPVFAAQSASPPPPFTPYPEVGYAPSSFPLAAAYPHPYGFYPVAALPGVYPSHGPDYTSSGVYPPPSPNLGASHSHDYSANPGSGASPSYSSLPSSSGPYSFFPLGAPTPQSVPVQAPSTALPNPLASEPCMAPPPVPMADDLRSLPPYNSRNFSHLLQLLGHVYGYLYPGGYDVAAETNPYGVAWQASYGIDLVRKQLAGLEERIDELLATMRSWTAPASVPPSASSYAYGGPGSGYLPHLPQSQRAQGSQGQYAPNGDAHYGPSAQQWNEEGNHHDGQAYYNGQADAVHLDPNGEKVTMAPAEPIR